MSDYELTKYLFFDSTLLHSLLLESPIRIEGDSLAVLRESPVLSYLYDALMGADYHKEDVVLFIKACLFSFYLGEELSKAHRFHQSGDNEGGYVPSLLDIPIFYGIDDEFYATFSALLLKIDEKNLSIITRTLSSGFSHKRVVSIALEELDIMKEIGNLLLSQQEVFADQERRKMAPLIARIEEGYRDALRRLSFFRSDTNENILSRKKLVGEITTFVSPLYKSIAAEAFLLSLMKEKKILNTSKEKELRAEVSDKVLFPDNLLTIRDIGLQGISFPPHLYDEPVFMHLPYVTAMQMEYDISSTSSFRADFLNRVALLSLYEQEEDHLFEKRRELDTLTHRLSESRIRDGAADMISGEVFHMGRQLRHALSGYLLMDNEVFYPLAKMGGDGIVQTVHNAILDALTKQRFFLSETNDDFYAKIQQSELEKIVRSIAEDIFVKYTEKRKEIRSMGSEDKNTDGPGGKGSKSPAGETPKQKKHKREKVIDIKMEISEEDPAPRTEPGIIEAEPEEEYYDIEETHHASDTLF